jgi:hypothetical protein
LKSLARSERFLTSEVVSEEFLMSLPVSEEFLTCLPVISLAELVTAFAAKEGPPSATKSATSATVLAKVRRVRSLASRGASQASTKRRPP